MQPPSGHTEELAGKSQAHCRLQENGGEVCAKGGRVFTTRCWGELKQVPQVWGPGDVRKSGFDGSLGQRQTGLRGRGKELGEETEERQLFVHFGRAGRRDKRNECLRRGTFTKRCLDLKVSKC